MKLMKTNETNEKVNRSQQNKISGKRKEKAVNWYFFYPAKLYFIFECK